MKNRLAVFDLDGTLLDTIGDLAESCNFMLRKRGLTEYGYDDYCHFVGNGITRLVERALPEELRTADYVAAARRDFVDYYIDHIDLHTKPYDGIPELVETLYRSGWKLAVASNKFNDGTRKLVNKFFPDIRFSAVYGNRDGVPLKPDAALLRQIMVECGSSPERCWMIGDSGIDMQTAHNAGTHSIGVSWGFRAREELVENGAEHIADRPEDIIAILAGAGNESKK